MAHPTILVTGATDGIGKQTALELAKAGATVIVHGRSQKKCEATAHAIRTAPGSGQVELAVFDLTSLQAIRDGVARIADKHPKLDVLINNAGVYMQERELTTDGYETTFQVNHLAPFLITHLLLPNLEASGAGRIITVSSMVHVGARLMLHDLQAKQWFSAHAAYAHSKLANVLFTVELAERLGGRPLTANCLHPGVIGTKLLREGFGALGGDSVEHGAATSVYLALSPEVAQVSGRYFVNRREASPSQRAADVEHRRQLWDVSAELCGLTETLPPAHRPTARG